MSLPAFLARRRQQSDTDTDTARCRSCSAPIVWIVTDTGARTPCDAEPIEAWLFVDLEQAGADRGLEETPRGYYLGAKVVPAIPARPGVLPEVPRTRVRRSHFATCPQANEHRRPKAERARTEVDDG